jgi:hypothetical protein
MKLLLDVHHSPRAAERLREKGHDVVAAASEAHLASLGDEDLLRFATTEGRAVVTENVKDFERGIRSWGASGEHHGGIVFTSPRRFHRGSLAYPENLVVALQRFLDEPAPPGEDWAHWLS